MKVQRLSDEITIADLEKFPVWEFDYEEKEMMTYPMKPYSHTLPYDANKTRLLVRATFLLANGAKKIGHIKPINIVDKFMDFLLPIDLLPVIFTENGVVDFWYGCFKPTHDEILKNYSLLGYSSPSEIFPIAISSDVEVANSISNGILDGFMYYSKNEVNDLSHILKTDIKIIV